MQVCTNLPLLSPLWITLPMITLSLAIMTSLSLG
jgi:hypothetical protein